MAESVREISKVKSTVGFLLQKKKPVHTRNLKMATHLNSSEKKTFMAAQVLDGLQDEGMQHLVRLRNR